MSVFDAIARLFDDELHARRGGNGSGRLSSKKRSRPITAAKNGPSGHTASVEPRDGTSFGTYTITRLLGRGGMGEVYEAYDTVKGRTVALKILSDGGVSHDPAFFRARFQRESQAAAILQEPHVIPIHDWGEIDGRLYIDMRLVQGAHPGGADRRGAAGARAGSRHHHADGRRSRCRARCRPDPPGCQAREHHRHPPGRFRYLVDFGIAETKGATRLTEAGSQIGTLKYMAPERFNGEPATPPRSTSTR